MRLREDEGALRDAAHLSSYGDPGRAGRVHRLWRDMSTGQPDLELAGLEGVCRLLDAAALPSHSAAQLLALWQADGDPVDVAARAATAAGDGQSRPEAEILGAWAADCLLAKRIGWSRPLPLLLTQSQHPILRAANRRIRPGDDNWAVAAAAAYALAATAAYDLAQDLARRAARLESISPRLRAKGAIAAVQLLLGDDCVAAAHAARRCGLSDRAARRLFDRLRDLGAVRELSGRSNFRLYGL